MTTGSTTGPSAQAVELAYMGGGSSFVDRLIGIERGYAANDNILLACAA